MFLELTRFTGTNCIRSGPLEQASAKHVWRVVAMSDHNDARQSVPQTPPPGSYPESFDIRPSPSVASTSIRVRDEVRTILDSAQFKVGTLKGEPIVMFPKADWASLEQKLLALDNRQGNSVPVSELAELQRELSELRLQLNDFKSENERLEYATSKLNSALQHAKASEAKAKVEADESLALLNGTQRELRATLASVAATKKEFDIAIREAKKAGNLEDVDRLTVDKHRLSVDLTSLNNQLQQTNADKKAVQDKLKRFEMQVLNLTSELNAEKSRHAIHSRRPGTSFADKARAAQGETVRLYNIACNNLSSLAKSRFDKIKDNPTEDERNTVFWLKAAFDATKHEVYRPYKLVFGGMAEDLKAYTAPSRKVFDHFLIAVRDSLLPTGQPLSLDDMNMLLSSIDQEKLLLNRHFRNKGFRSLKDLTDHGLSVGAPDASDINYRLVNGQLEPLTSEKSEGKKPVRPSTPEKLVLRHLEDVSPRSLPMADPPLEDDQVSYWVRVREWFHVKFDSMSARIRNSLRRRPQRLERYFKLATGNMFQRFALIPYSWFIWIFP